LLFQSLEHERGDIQEYETALEYIVNEKLKPKTYLDQTRKRVDPRAQLRGVEFNIAASKSGPHEAPRWCPVPLICA
jgi:hypothetical protein